MRVRNDYVHGAHNKICDRTGFKIKSTEARQEWNGSVVRRQDWEARHPQDYVRGVKDLQSVSDPRPGAPDINLTSETTLDADELAGQTIISVTSTSNMTAGDAIIIFLDDQTSHLSTIASLVENDTVTINDALPSKAASGNKVVYVTNRILESSL